MSQASYCTKHNSIYDANSGNCRHCDDTGHAPLPTEPEVEGGHQGDGLYDSKHWPTKSAPLKDTPVPPRVTAEDIADLEKAKAEMQRVRESISDIIPEFATETPGADTPPTQGGKA